jgi:hypothetical protein
MLGQLGGDRVGHDLAAMDFSGLAPVHSGMPIRVRVAVNGHPEIAGADPLLHDFFKLSRCLLLLIQMAGSLLKPLATADILHGLDRAGDLDQLAGCRGSKNGWSAANFIDSFQPASSLLRLR